MPQRRAALHRENVNAMATIEARGLRKTFGTTVALEGIDLHIEEGRILGIIGPMARVRQLHLMRFWGSLHTREN